MPNASPVGSQEMMWLYSGLEMIDRRVWGNALDDFFLGKVMGEEKLLSIKPLSRERRSSGAGGVLSMEESSGPDDTARTREHSGRVLLDGTTSTVEDVLLVCFAWNLCQLLRKLILRCLMDTLPSPIQFASELLPCLGKLNPTITASASNMAGFIAFASIDFLIRGSILERNGLTEVGVPNDLDLGEELDGFEDEVVFWIDS